MFAGRPGTVVSSIAALLALVAGAIVLTPLALSQSHPLLIRIALILLPLFFLIAFINTNFALILLIFSMLFSPEYQLGGIPGRNIVVRIDDILLFMVFFGWLVRMSVEKDIGLVRISELNRPIAAYIGICLLSSAYGSVIGTNTMLKSFFYILKYSEYFVIFLS